MKLVSFARNRMTDVYINPEHVVYVSPHSEGTTRIVLIASGGDDRTAVVVVGAVNEVIAKLQAG